MAGGRGGCCWEEVPRVLSHLGGEGAWREQVCVFLALRQECGGPGEQGPDEAGPELEGDESEFCSKFIGKGIDLKHFSSDNVWAVW